MEFHYYGFLRVIFNTLPQNRLLALHKSIARTCALYWHYINPIQAHVRAMDLCSPNTKHTCVQWIYVLDFIYILNNLRISGGLSQLLKPLLRWLFIPYKIFNENTTQLTRGVLTFTSLITRNALINTSLVLRFAPHS